MHRNGAGIFRFVCGQCRMIRHERRKDFADHTLVAGLFGDGGSGVGGRIHCGFVSRIFSHELFEFGHSRRGIRRGSSLVFTISSPSIRAHVCIRISCNTVPSIYFNFLPCIGRCPPELQNLDASNKRIKSSLDRLAKLETGHEDTQ
jgi:hypothetical protein